MNKIDFLTRESGKVVYIKVMCDDPMQPQEDGSDMYFELSGSAIYKLEKLIETYEELGLNYDVVIEEFDEEEQCVSNVIYIVSKNSQNDVKSNPSL